LKARVILRELLGPITLTPKAKGALEASWSWNPAALGKGARIVGRGDLVCSVPTSPIEFESSSYRDARIGCHRTGHLTTTICQEVTMATSYDGALWRTATQSQMTQRSKAMIAKPAQRDVEELLRREVLLEHAQAAASVLRGGPDRR
jgi:hypothetical protein